MDIRTLENFLDLDNPDNPTLSHGVYAYIPSYHAEVTQHYWDNVLDAIGRNRPWETIPKINATLRAYHLFYNYLMTSINVYSKSYYTKQAYILRYLNIRAEQMYASYNKLHPRQRKPKKWIINHRLLADHVMPANDESIRTLDTNLATIWLRTNRHEHPLLVFRSFQTTCPDHSNTFHYHYYTATPLQVTQHYADTSKQSPRMKQYHGRLFPQTIGSSVCGRDVKFHSPVLLSIRDVDPIYNIVCLTDPVTWVNRDPYTMLTA